MKGEKRGKDESKERGREGKAKGRRRRRRVSQKGNLRPATRAAGSVQQSMFLGFVARQRSSRVSSSLLASFQPSRIFNEKQLYKHVVCVHKHSRETKKNEDGELILPKRHFTRNSWLTFSLWAMPTAGDIIMAKQRSKKRKKKETHQALWSLVSSCTLFGPCLLSRWWRSWFFQGQAYLLCKFFCQSAPMTMLMLSSGAKQIPGDTFSTMAYADFFASHIHFAIISWLFAIHQALCIITHPFLCNSITGESRSLWLWVMPPSGLLLIWNLLGLLPRYLWRAGRTLEPTGN